MENNVLSKDFHGRALIKYTLPSIATMIFMSLYVIVDGIFVAQLVGETALSAINIVFPVVSMVLAVGLMYGTGATAIIGKFMGEGKLHEARKFLCTIYIVGATLGILITIGLLIFSEEIVSLLGAEGNLVSYAEDYLTSMAIFMAPMIFQVFCQTLLIAAGRPGLAFLVCFTGGCFNMIFDYLLISPNWADLGIVGAGIATGIGNAIPGIFGLLFFAFYRKGSLYFEKPLWDFKLVGRSMYNGMSELVSNISIAITTFLFNIILLQLVGEGGVAAISIILYIQMFQAGIYFGYSIGVAPIIAFKFGEKNHDQLEKVIRFSFKFIMAASVLVIAISVIFADYAVAIFISPESTTFPMAKQGLIIFSIAYLFMGINIFMSAMFTAFSNGRVSATISITRSLIILVACLIILPQFIGIIGVWLAAPVAEGLSIILSIYYYKKYKKIYNY